MKKFTTIINISQAEMPEYLQSGFFIEDFLTINRNNRSLQYFFNIVPDKVNEYKTFVISILISIILFYTYYKLLTMTIILFLFKYCY
jgi:hypothetical protein